MTAIGKMLVFLVLLLSLVWNGLVVNAYVTRANWRAEAKKYQDKAAEAAEAARNLQAQAAGQAEAGEAATRVVREERDHLAARVAVMDKQLADLNTALQDMQAKQQKAVGKDAEIATNVQYLQDQVKTLTDDKAGLEARVNKMVITTEQAKANELRSKLDADAQLKRAEQLAGQVRDLNDRIGEMRSGGPQPVGSEARKSAPAAFRGTVRAFERSGASNFVALTPGLDAGLQKGASLKVYRLAPEAKYLGRVTITLVEPKEAVGVFTPRAGARLNADDFPRPGDELGAE